MQILITKLVKEFGLNQQQIADFFGIDRSIVSRIQSGERSLPAKAMQQGAQLLQAMQGIDQHVEKTTAAVKVDWPLMAQIVQEHILDCRLQTRRMEAELQQLQQRQAQTEKWTTVLQQMAQMPKHKTNGRNGRWLTEAQYQSSEQLKKHNTDQQWLIEIKIQALHATQECYEKELAVIKHHINSEGLDFAV